MAIQNTSGHPPPRVIARAGLSLAFAANARPSLAQLLDAAHATALPFTIDHGVAPDGNPASDWVEVLASGLAFALTGLRPAPPAETVAVRHLFGVDKGFDWSAAAFVTLRPGPHLNGGENLLPVVRVMADAGAALAALLTPAAVVWHPAAAASEPALFQRLVSAWLAGGAFPALGLTALTRASDGTLQSEGLDFFTGQELRLDAALALDESRAGKIAVRLIHDLVEAGPLTGPHSFTGPAGEALAAAPDDGGRLLNIWETPQP